MTLTGRLAEIDRIVGKGSVHRINQKTQFSMATAFFRPRIDVPGAFRHRGPIVEAQLDRASQLLRVDSRKNHVFFNDKGFHNHYAHMVLAQLSLGASPDGMEQSAETEQRSQKPLKPAHPSSEFEFSKKLGNGDYYHDYLNYFTEKVDHSGTVAPLTSHVFTHSDNMFSRFFSGAYHPFIHAGYGLEFDLPVMVAEALAQTAVHKSNVTPLVESIGLDRSDDVTKPANSTRDLFEIVDSVRHEPALDHVIESKDSPKFAAVVSRVSPVIVAAADRWDLSSFESVVDAANHLQIFDTAVCHGPPSTKQEPPVYDFFLMHALTSSCFLPAMVRAVSPDLAAALLRAKLRVDLAYYVSRDRPALAFDHYKGMTARSWDDLTEESLRHPDPHVPKAIRATLHASQNDGQNVFSEAVYRGMAHNLLVANRDGRSFSQDTFELSSL